MSLQEDFELFKAEITAKIDENKEYAEKVEDYNSEGFKILREYTERFRAVLHTAIHVSDLKTLEVCDRLSNTIMMLEQDVDLLFLRKPTIRR